MGTPKANMETPVGPHMHCSFHHLLNPRKIGVRRTPSHANPWLDDAQGHHRSLRFRLYVSHEALCLTRELPQE